MKARGGWIAIAAAMLVAGCASDITPTPPGTPPPAPLAYHIGPDDHLRITVYGEPQLTGEYIVNNEGQISFPIAGLVPAGGLTVAELAERLTDALGKTYKAPQVSIDPIAYRPIYLLGEVNKAGQYPYASGMTVLAAVATAGGFTYRANKRMVMIRHPGAAAEAKLPLTADLDVQPGDVIRVKERYF